MTKEIKKYILIILSIIIGIAYSVLLIWFTDLILESKYKKETFVLLESQKDEPDIVNPYGVLNVPLEWSIYITQLSNELEVDPDLCVSILMRENPEFNPNAQHKNENGTVDVGLWQLNDKYLYSNFLNKYWDIELEFNAFNWKHNTYVAIHHIAYLNKRLKTFNDTVCAYNCGIGAVLNDKIPDITKTYLSSASNTYKLLKERK